MDEVLKSLRMMHRLLMGLSATILLFALSPDPATRYVAPIHELELLQEALEQEPAYVESLVVLAEQSGPELAAIRTALDRALEAQGFASEEDASRATEFTIGAQHDFPEPPHAGMSLAEILAALERDRSVHHFRLAEGTIQQRLEEALLPLSGKVQGPLEAFEMTWTGIARVDGELTSDEEFQPFHFDLRFYDPLGGGAFEVHRREGVARALSPAARKKGHGKV